MSQLLILLPPRIAFEGGGDAAGAAAPQCPFALVSERGAIEQEGRRPLADFADAVLQAQQVVLMVAGSDVTLVHLAVPPLSPAKLKAALPHLVEDQLISEPSSCAIAAGPRIDGMRTVAVVQRDWLALLANAFATMGARNLRVLPSSLCLPLTDHAAAAALCLFGAQSVLTIRLSAHMGLGLPLPSAHGERAAEEAIAMLRVLVPAGAVTLYVSPGASAPIEASPARELSDVAIVAGDWGQWAAGARDCPIDLIKGLGAWSGGGKGAAWRAWRGQLMLACAVLLLNVVALNLAWWQLRGESRQLKASMLADYRRAYPSETVIVDPIAQTRQKIVAARQAGGSAALDDFTVLAAQFGAAWNGLAATDKKPAVASLEYRDHSLFVRLKKAGDGLAPVADRLKNALEGSGLTLSQPAADLWRIHLAEVKK